MEIDIDLNGQWKDKLIPKETESEHEEEEKKQQLKGIECDMERAAKIVNKIASLVKQCIP